MAPAIDGISDSFSDLSSEDRDLVGDDGQDLSDASSGNIQQRLPKVRKLTFKETSGFGIFDDKGTTTIRYVDRESGNIFEVNTKEIEIKRITNTTILRTFNSFWSDPDNLLIQYIDDNEGIRSYSASIKIEDDQTIGSLSGDFIENNIEEVDVLDGQVFWLSEKPTSSSGLLSDLKQNKPREILSIPLKEFNVSWVNKNTIALNTKPSALSFGYLFLLKTNGSLEEVLHKITGLSSVVSDNGVLYSSSLSRGVSLWYLNRESGEVIKSPRDTLAEKCVLANEGRIAYCAVPKSISYTELPDRWYKGLISFSDDLWRIDFDSNETKLVAELSNIDVLSLGINKEDNYLVLENKSDLTLWGVDLNQD